MSEELTLEGVAEIADIDFNQLEDIARAHLSRPVVEDEQMREAVIMARSEIDGFENSSYEDMRRKFGNSGAIAWEVSRATLTMSEQLAEANKLLAAEQAKVKALQPYKDAYEAGQDMFAVKRQQKEKKYRQAFSVKSAAESYLSAYAEFGMAPDTVRVCKLVEGG